MMKVLLIGAGGRMGREALKALTPNEGFEISAVVLRSGAFEGHPAYAGAEQALAAVPVDAVLDLSLASAALENAQASLSARKPYVSGVTGLSTTALTQIQDWTEEFETPALIVPNFAIGAVLMMKFAEMAARWLPDAEVIERHHEGKRDAPSGTAMLTAQKIAAGRKSAPTVAPTELFKVEGARGGSVEGVPVHSVRLPGSLAHQEILFGGPGETLKISHDAADRSVYMPGVRLCLRRISAMKGLTIGLESLLE